MENYRITWIDRMRGLAILSVVIQHLTYNFTNVFVYHKFIGISNMAVFFFVSGYIWEYTANILNGKDAFQYIIKKSIQIFIPLCVWSFLNYPYAFSTSWNLFNLDTLIKEFTSTSLVLINIVWICFLFRIMENCLSTFRK